MFKKTGAVFAVAIILPFSSHAAEGDWGLAEINFVKASLPGNFSIQSRSQFTWRDNFDEFYFWFVDAGLAYSITPSWRAELVYRHANWFIADEWEEERRPTFNLDWFGTLKGARLNNLARIEYRDYQWNKEDDWRFRDRFRAEFPQEILPGGIKPFLEEEVFVGNNRGTVEMNWLTAGIYCKPAKNLKLKAGYRWIAIRVGDGHQWENRNQLVTGLAMYF